MSAPSDPAAAYYAGAPFYVPPPASASASAAEPRNKPRHWPNVSIGRLRLLFFGLSSSLFRFLFSFTVDSSAAFSSPPPAPASASFAALYASASFFSSSSSHLLLSPLSPLESLYVDLETNPPGALVDAVSPRASPRADGAFSPPTNDERLRRAVTARELDARPSSPPRAPRYAARR